MLVVWSFFNEDPNLEEELTCLGGDGGNAASSSRFFQSVLTESSETVLMEHEATLVCPRHTRRSSSISVMFLCVLHHRRFHVSCLRRVSSLQHGRVCREHIQTACGFLANNEPLECPPGQLKANIWFYRHTRDPKRAGIKRHYGMAHFGISTLNLYRKKWIMQKNQ